MARVQSAILWIATTIVLASALPLGANRPLTWIVLSTALVTLFAAQVALDMRSKTPARVFAPLLPAAALYLGVMAWAVVQALPAPRADWAHPAWLFIDGGGVGSISLNPDMTWQFVLRGIGYAGAFWIAVRGTADPGRAKALIDVIALWIAALAVYGLVARFTGVNPIRGSIDAYADSVTASFVNRNTYAFYAGLGLMASLAAFIRRATSGSQDFGPEEGRRARRAALERLLGPAALFLLAAAVTALALTLTQSRAGIAVSLVGATVMLAAFMLQRRAAAIVVTPVLLAAGLAVTLLSVSGFVDRIGEAGLDDGNRLEVYALTILGIMAAPLLGHGLGAFQEGFRPYTEGGLASVDFDLAHNGYLEAAFELGCPAAAALMLALALIGWRLWRGVRMRRRMIIAPAFALGVFCAGALHSLVDFSLQTPAVTALFAMVLGMGWIQSWSSLSSLVPADPAARPRRSAPQAS